MKNPCLHGHFILAGRGESLNEENREKVRVVLAGETQEVSLMRWFLC